MARRQNEAVWVERNQRWQINVQRNGQRKTFNCATPGKRGKIETERKADKWLSNMEDDNISFTEAWSSFAEYKESTTGTANAVKLDSIYRTWFEPYLKRKKLCMITCQDWQSIVVSAAKAGRSKRTCQNIRSAATSLYAFARQNRWEMEKPEYISVPKYTPTKKKEILQPDDLNVLFSIDYITHYKKKVFAYYIYAYRFIVALGLRRGELAGIKNDDINDNVLHIVRSRNSLGEITDGKTENAERRILLPAFARNILEQQRRLLADYEIESDYVFPDPSGEIMDTNKLYDHWDTYRKQHGIKSNLHELRHTMISLVKADMPEQLLKPIVGHSVDMDTYGVYGHEVDGDLERASEIMDIVFSKIIKSQSVC